METVLSSLLNLMILGLMGAVAVAVLDRRDPFECRTEGRRLSDEELVRHSLAFLRGEQTDTAVTPRVLPAGYDITESDAILADPRFLFEITRDGDGPGDVLKPRRTWPERQIFGASLAVGLTLPGETAEAPVLQVLHVSDPCGTVTAEWGPGRTGRTGTAAPAETE